MFYNSKKTKKAKQNPFSKETQVVETRFNLENLCDDLSLINGY